MKPTLHRAIYLLLIGIAVILAYDSNTAAQESGLEKLAERLSTPIVNAGINSVVVADFVTKEGEASPAGYYLAGELSQSLYKYSKGFVLVDGRQLTQALAGAQILPKDLAAADSLERIGVSLKVDAVVTGTLESTTSHYALKVVLRSVRDGGLVDSEDESVKRPGIADGMVLLASKALPERLAVAGQDGIGIPTCEYCPAPLFGRRIQKKRLQGNVVLVVVITSDGHAGESTVTETPDAALAKQAIKAVAKWKFKPATDKEGKPVSALTPVEITIRLF